MQSLGTGQSRSAPLTSGCETAVLGRDPVVVCAVHENNLEQSIRNLDWALIELANGIVLSSSVCYS